MLPRGLHSLRRNYPDVVSFVDLRPCGFQNFTGSGGRQNQLFKSQPNRFGGIDTPKLNQEVGNVGVGQGFVMFVPVCLLGQAFGHPLDGVVTGSEA